jgi:predicted enzyme related to lactoylglutathione lyase
MATVETAAATGAIAYDGGLTCSMGVTSLDKSIPWYSEVLGMTLLYRRDDIAWCELSTGVDKVNVGLSQNREAGGPGGSTLTFGVTDIDAAKAALDAAGVRQDGEIMEIPGLVKLLTFYDPDDNALMFYQHLSGAHEAA